MTEPSWQWEDDGRFITAQGPVLGLRLAYGGKGSEGWFKGGGGQDLGIVELYYKPTAPSRNLIFRNGAWGGKMDALDYWEVKAAAKSGLDHNTPDFASTTDARLLNHQVRQSAGRLIVRGEFQLQSWRIERTCIIYPWGDMTVHARLRLTEESRWNYLGHRFHFAASRYRLEVPRRVDWGSNYQDDGETMYAWSDMYGPQGKFQGREPFLYEEKIRSDLNRNTAISMFGRQDPYSGFMIDDRNGDDPDIIVCCGDRATFVSPFDLISRKIGGVNYVETGMFTPPWHKQKLTHVDCCWFYATVKPPAYDQPMLWKTDLGQWEESFHLFFRQGLGPDDYLPLWRARVRDLAEQAPQDVVGAAVVLDPLDRLYHLRIEPAAKTISFRWQRAGSAPRALDYRTAFVLEGIGTMGSVTVAGSGAAAACVYPDAADGSALLVLTGPQPAEPAPVWITIQRP